MNERFMRDFFGMRKASLEDAVCANCRFFRNANGYGQCKRHAPSTTKDERGGGWPWVSSADFCGDHEPKDSSA